MKGFRNLTWNYKLLEEFCFFKVSSEDTRASPYLLHNKQSVLVEFASYMFHPVMLSIKISPFLMGHLTFYCPVFDRSQCINL
jgi:hypothetical protein